MDYENLKLLEVMKAKLERGERLTEEEHRELLLAIIRVVLT